MIFGKTENHKLVFPKNKKAEKEIQSNVQIKESPEKPDPISPKPLTAGQEIEKKNKKAFDEAAREMKMVGESKRQRK